MAFLARQLYFEAVKVGDELPPLVKPPVDRTQIARYVGASGDFNPLYIDEHLAKNAGFPSSHAPAMLAMGFIGELVVDWLRGARLRRYTARFLKIIWPGDVITCRGRVVDRRFEGSGTYAIDLEVWAENQRGEPTLKGLVTAQLYYSAEDDARQRSGLPPLVVTSEEEAAHLARLSRSQPARSQEPPPPPPPAEAQATGPALAARGEGPAAGGTSGTEAGARQAARPPPKRGLAGPRKHSANKARPVPRSPPRTKPAARASRPRTGSKPTGRKRR
ncbi:MAG TPA: MaoC/PaaZ C-terminal domain-containing protein [Anaeromyxobacteraceae bacterium]|nr:MaoC/PaaZ C-terminal domain-containing protein [Anaeromyxobacteraceae bacterium]